MAPLAEVTFVTGNENKWREVQAILGDSIRVNRAKLDCMHRIHRSLPPHHHHYQQQK